MPYIDPARRAMLTRYAFMGEHTILNSGELNFLIFKLIEIYIHVRTERGTRKINYSLLNEISGALTCAQAEFQRRVVAPYEDGKIKQHGDLKFLEEIKDGLSQLFSD